MTDSTLTVQLLLLIAAITYGSRVGALALLPPMPQRVAVVLARMPTALFAGLAMHSLISPGPEIASTTVLAAAAGAVLVAPLRSLPICLLAGVAAYVVVATMA